jgi:cytochrome P450
VYACSKSPEFLQRFKVSYLSHLRDYSRRSIDSSKKDILGIGVFCSDQKSLWKFHRNLTRPHFAKEITNDFSHFSLPVEKTIDYLKSVSSKGQSLDIQDLFARLTMDIGTKLFFGTSIDSLEELIRGPSRGIAGVEAREFVKAFTESLFYGSRRRFRPFWPITEKIFGNPNEKNMKLIGKVWDDVITKKIEDRRIQQKEGEMKIQHETLLDHLISQTDDLKLIKDELLNILLAARDTTAALMTSVM